MNKLILALVFSFFLVAIHAQTEQKPGKGKITGQVVDSLLKTPIDYASVGLLDQETKNTINGTTTDENGLFNMDQVPAGNYKLVIYFVGYKNFTQENIRIKESDSVLNLGMIGLVGTGTALDAVEINYYKPLIENKIDKIVYNAENDVTSQGGTALDILKKVPQVNVDADGVVELQGNPNIRFLINGKPSSMFGNSLADALASIPASQIKSIEAITSPGAKFDAAGTGGIINIILKESKVKGINGNVSLSAGTRFENGSFNLNYRNKNFGLNAFFSGNGQLVSHTPNSQSRYSTDTSSQTTTQLLQDGNTDAGKHSYRTGIGFDWSPDKSNSFTGGFSYDVFSFQNTSVIDQDQITGDYSGNVVGQIQSSRNSYSSVNVPTLDWNLNYKKNFKKEGHQLDVVYSSSYGTPKSNYTQSQTFQGSTSPYSGISGSNPGTDLQTNISIDYVNPIKENWVIEGGIKTVQQEIRAFSNVSLFNTSTNDYDPDPLQSYHLNYNMAVYAAYVSSSFKISNLLNVKAGLRTEYTNLNIDFPNTSIPAYTILSPSVIVSRDLKNDQTIKLSYNRRIERPDYRELNPFMNLSDPRNITTGNPGLKPEIGNNSELGYNKIFKKGATFSFSLIERINTQDIKQITTFYPTYVINDSTYLNVSLNNVQNMGTEYNSGGNISWSIPLFSKNLTIRGNIMATNRYMRTGTYLGNVSMGMRYRLNMNISWQLKNNLVVEAFGNYNSAAQNIQGKNPQFLTYTFAFRKQFWDKKASFGFTTTNPFQQYVRQTTTLSGANYNSSSIKWLPYRSFGVSFTWKFGKLEFKDEEKEDSNEFLMAPAQ